MSARESAEVLKIDPAHPQPDVIKRAAAVIRAGGLVAFPTETVYGLGADALNERAVARVFQAKKRTPDAPLIVLVSDRQMLRRVAASVPPIAERLMSRFWPGPLTLTFPASSSVPAIVTGGLEGVSVRMPGNRIALELVRVSDTPIVAPSANLHGRASSISAQHVLQDLGDAIDLVLDAGKVGAGIESTILDTTQTPPKLIRRGAVSLSNIEDVVGEVAAEGASAGHHAPRGRLVVVKSGDREAVARLVRECAQRGTNVALVTRRPDLYRPDEGLTVKAMPLDVSEYAQRLFGVLRELDDSGAGCIAVEEVEEVGIGAAIMDRLRRAAERSGEAGR